MDVEGRRAVKLLNSSSSVARVAAVLVVAPL